MAEILTAKDQIHLVRERYPELKVVCGWPWLVIWEGPVRSFARTYLVRIFWHRFWPGDFEVPNPNPQIVVLDPPLQDRPDERIPHMYRRSGRTDRVCGWDPAADDWDFTKPVADTIIPFIVQWLCSYEIWRVTGDWPAPGRHPELPCQNEKYSSSPGQRALSMAAEFVRIGRLTGTFASSALMAAASEESSHWLSFRDWKPSTFEGDRLPIISTSSRALRQVASSHLDSLAA